MQGARHLDQVARLTPDISFSRIDGSFHFIMLDQAELFAEAIITFINR